MQGRSWAGMGVGWVAVLAAALAGCGTVRETLPPRSAMEQLLISTAADRAVEELPTDWLVGKAGHLDISNLDCYDKPYVVQRLREAVLDAGGDRPRTPRTGGQVQDIPACQGRSSVSFWWFLVVGPVEWSDLPGGRQ